MRKAIALALLVVFPSFAQRAWAGDPANVHLLDEGLHAPVLIPRGALALVPSPRLLASAAPEVANPAEGEECTETCGPEYYDPDTGSDCVQSCDQAEGEEAVDESAPEDNVVRAVVKEDEQNPVVWIMVVLVVAAAIGAGAYFVSAQCDPVSGNNC